MTTMTSKHYSWFFLFAPFYFSYTCNFTVYQFDHLDVSLTRLTQFFPLVFNYIYVYTDVFFYLLSLLGRCSGSNHMCEVAWDQTALVIQNHQWPSLSDRRY